MLQRTLHAYQLRALLDEADDETLDKILEVGASWEEIEEAARMAQHVGPSGHLPSTVFVARLHKILFERRRQRSEGIIRAVLQFD